MLDVDRIAQHIEKEHLAIRASARLIQGQLGRLRAGPDSAELERLDGMLQVFQNQLARHFEFEEDVGLDPLANGRATHDIDAMHGELRSRLDWLVSEVKREGPAVSETFVQELRDFLTSLLRHDEAETKSLAPESDD